MSRAIAATREVFGLAEGPYWDAPRRQLLWVDILAGDVLWGTLGDDGMIEVRGRQNLDRFASAVAVDHAGRWVVATGDRLVWRDTDGSVHDLVTIVGSDEQRRLNDGAVDPAGRFVVGTASLAGPSTGERLVRVEDDLALTVLDSDLTLSNGLAWTADGRLLSVDSFRRVVNGRDYDAASGEVGTRTTVLEVTDTGIPDGTAPDEEGCLWVAAWSTGQARRYGRDGSLLDVIDVPCPHITNLAFAGDDLRTLVITTGRDELPEADRARYPDSGRLFTARVDVPGLPLPLWHGPR